MGSIVALHGSLEAFKLPDVLAFVNSAKKTGMLTVASETREAYVFCRNGSVVYAASNQESMRLGTLLLRKRNISKEQAETIDDLMLRGRGRFGDFAVTQGVLSEPQLDEYLKIQVSEVLYDSFLWKAGTFTFYDGFDLPPDAVTISVDLTNLIMEGARRIEQWEECLQLLPDSGAVFRVIPRPESEKITLTADEWKVLFLINGQRTLEDLCRDTTEDPLTVYRVVYGLWANKLIEEVEGISDAGLTIAVPGVLTPDTSSNDPEEENVEDTVIDAPVDDTNLLTTPGARLAYKDVVRTTVGQLAVLNGDLEGTVYLLTDAEYSIGRQPDNTFQIADLGISGHHARIFRGPDGYVLEDLKSRNGTWLNGTRVYHAVLQSSDAIRIGSTDLKYEVLYDDGPTRPGM
jgi:hypothetical protein